MKQLALLIFNTATLLYALVMNGLSNSSAFNGKSVGEISDKYETLFAPAGYAFSIWGLIYLLLILFVGHQWYQWLKQRNDTELMQTGIWFALGNIANGTWIIAWLGESMGASLLLMGVLLVSLIVITIELRLEIWNAPKRIIVFVWWPIAIYLGWIIVASVANTAALLVGMGWEGSFLSAKTWTIVMIFAATLIYLLLIYYRNLREAALVGIWALIAIAVKHGQTNPSLVAVAIAASGILLIAIVVHAFQNKAAQQFAK